MAYAWTSSMGLIFYVGKGSTRKVLFPTAKSCLKNHQYEHTDETFTGPAAQPLCFNQVFDYIHKH